MLKVGDCFRCRLFGQEIEGVVLEIVDRYRLGPCYITADFDGVKNPIPAPCAVVDPGMTKLTNVLN